MLPSYAFDTETFVFASPKPLRYINILTPFYPVTSAVWIAIVITIFIFSVFLWRISILVEKWFHVDMCYWSTFSLSFFYVYGSMLGQSVTRETNLYSRHSQTIRL